MFRVDVDFTGFDAALRNTKLVLAHQMSIGVTGAAAKAVAHAKQYGPFQDRTGQLRGSIHAEPGAFTPKTAECWFVSPMFYSRFVEEGTRAHEIWPKEGHGFVGPLRRSQGRRELDDIGTHRVKLRWFVGGDGTPGNEGQAVFAYMVHHPGGKPYPFMKPARDHAESWLVQELDRGFYQLQALWG